MKAKKFGMTELELQEYCDSLSEKDLKKFQLDSVQSDIDLWKHKLQNTICRLVIVIMVMFSLGNIGLIICGIVSLGLIVYTIRCYNYMRSNQLLYRMLIMFFEKNNI